MLFGSKNRGAVGRETEELEVLDAEFTSTEVVPYTGIVRHTNDGYSFIGSVRRGTETVNTNGDVFCPMALPKDAVVQFDELNGDQERSSAQAGSKFRTESARVVEGGLVKLSSALAPVPKDYLLEISKRQSYHSAKEIDPLEAEKAANCGPFADMLGLHLLNQQRPIETAELAEAFLRDTFFNLSSIGVEYTIRNDVDQEAEGGLVAKAMSEYTDSGMAGTASSIEDEYRKFMGVRGVFRLMQMNNILSVENVIPLKYAPDLTVVAPVMFIESRIKEEIYYTEDQNQNLMIDQLGQMLCDYVGTKEYAWFYQMYNKRPRPIANFTGRDIMPLPLLKIFQEARQTFDFVAIFTPYHDIASQEWRNERWQRNRDPFLVGFMRGLDYMFLLGRWVSHGLFPLVCDMIADTMSHLKTNKSLLKNFHPDNYWYFGNGRLYNTPLYHCLWEREIRLGGDRVGNDVLEPFADQALEAYEAGRLFQFLRGEEKKEELKKTA